MSFVKRRSYLVVRPFGWSDLRLDTVTFGIRGAGIENAAGGRSDMARGMGGNEACASRSARGEPVGEYPAGYSKSSSGKAAADESTGGVASGLR